MANKINRLRNHTTFGELCVTTYNKKQTHTYTNIDTHEDDDDNIVVFVVVLSQKPSIGSLNVVVVDVVVIVIVVLLCLLLLLKNDALVSICSLLSCWFKHEYKQFVK